ncbi:replication initiation protein [Actinospica sp. MGRD01-02]|uniref:Replication initiation protein n=1 Tax=Actinospica acidithermotolerans TaxID=2828514 RepID=A0A941ED64_9ACTN|nr:replication initiator [Actinospica acidithermotolerans]MBR7830570.1 replication initiation protein [Actinospica acidithermotolerans]
MVAVMLGNGERPVLRISHLSRMVGPEFRAWYRALERLGGCAEPVMLVGHTLTRDAGTGELLHVFRSGDLPFGTLMVACRNRRESVCLPCSLLHNGDTFQIVKSGLSGGKGVPAAVSNHPRVFVTVTAPSFGPVHRVTDNHRASDRCRVRRGNPQCPHGNRLWCTATHGAADPRVGVPLCPECYDYAGAVLWNASFGVLWNQFVKQIGRAAAERAGVRRGELPKLVRLSFAKVVEFQRRGSIHAHAVFRFDGPDGPGDAPPVWASVGLLRDAVTAAGPSTHRYLTGPGGGRRTLALGRELDVREITGTGSDERALSETAVGSYIAKYVTKGEPAGMVLPHRLRHVGQIEAAPLSGHARRLMRTAWELGEVPEYEGLHLQMWANQLGFRGNIATKSRVYSTTYGALREGRAAYRRELAGVVEPKTGVVRESSWQFVGKGLAPDLAEIAEGIAEETAIRKGPRPDWIDVGGDT